MKSILIITPTYKPRNGGIEDQVEKEYELLKLMGYKVELLVVELKSHFSGLQEEQYGHRVDLGIYYYSSKVRTILKQKWDLIHLHDPRLFLLPRLFLFDFKKIYLSTHGLFFHTEKNIWIKNIYFFIASRFFVPKLGGVICTGDVDYQRIKSHNENIVLIQPGIVIGNEVKVKRRFEKIKILNHGRFAKNKCIEKTVELVKEIRNKYQLNIDLYITGGKAEEEVIVNINEIAKSNSWMRVELDISRDRLLELHSACDYYMSASLYEGFGIAPIEASAAGVPCILNNYEMARKIFKNGEDAFVLDFFEPNAAEKIYEILSIDEGEYSRVSASAIKMAGKHSFENRAKEMFDFMKIFG